jgi:hypothetical protein
MSAWRRPTKRRKSGARGWNNSVHLGECYVEMVEGSSVFLRPSSNSVESLQLEDPRAVMYGDEVVRVTFDPSQFMFVRGYICDVTVSFPRARVSDASKFRVGVPENCPFL